MPRIWFGQTDNTNQEAKPVSLSNYVSTGEGFPQKFCFVLCLSSGHEGGLKKRFCQNAPGGGLYRNQSCFLYILPMWSATSCCFKFNPAFTVFSSLVCLCLKSCTILLASVVLFTPALAIVFIPKHPMYPVSLISNLNSILEVNGSKAVPGHVKSCDRTNVDALYLQSFYNTCTTPRHRLSSWNSLEPEDLSST